VSRPLVALLKCETTERVSTPPASRSCSTRTVTVLPPADHSPAYAPDRRSTTSWPAACAASGARSALRQAADTEPMTGSFTPAEQR
jgi:hypothetical protein